MKRGNLRDSRVGWIWYAMWKVIKHKKMYWNILKYTFTELNKLTNEKKNIQNN